MEKGKRRVQKERSDARSQENNQNADDPVVFCGY